MKVTIGAAVLFGISAICGAANAHQLTLENLTSYDIVHAWVENGEIQGFRRVGWGSYRTFDVQLPKGRCETTLTVTFASGQSLSTEAEVCGGMHLKITRQ